MQRGKMLDNKVKRLDVIGESVDFEFPALANYALGLENEDIHFRSGVKLFFVHKSIMFCV